jgi:hypothetical protein
VGPNLATWIPYSYRGTWRGGVPVAEPYVAGDFVAFRGNLYRALVDVTGGATPDAAPAVWQRVATPSTASVPKVNANTATFNELYRAYWSVMADGPGRTPYDDRILGAVNASLNEDFDTLISNDWADILTPPAIPGLSAIPMFRNPYIGSRFVAGFPFDPIRRRIAPDDVMTEPAQHPARMFRSSLRAVPEAGAAPYFDQGVPRFDAYQMLLLRAAIAAVNTEDLRDSDQDVTARMISLKVSMRPAEAVIDPPVIRPVSVTVYGSERQPFMTKVYASGAGGDVAVELFNPYPTPLILNNYRFASINRDTIGTYVGATPPGRPPHLLLTDLGPVETALGSGAPITIEPFSRIVITSAAALATPPMAAGAPVPFVMTSIGDVLDGEGFELVLLRSRRYDGVASPGLTQDETGAPGDLVPEVTAMVPFPVVQPDLPRSRELAEMIPVDSYDFTGIDAAVAGWHYVRASHSEPVPGVAGPVTLKGWRHVYPGRYDATQIDLPRHQGTIADAAFAATPPVFLGGTLDPAASTPLADEDDDNNGFRSATDVDEDDDNGNNFLDDPARASYPVEFVVQYANQGLNGAGMNPARDYTAAPPTPNQYPYGGFARDGDLLSVTYFGAYRVQVDEEEAREEAEILELNSAPMDCSFVEDTDAIPENRNVNAVDGLPAIFEVENTALEGDDTPARIDVTEDFNGNQNGLIDTEDVNNNGQLGLPIGGGVALFYEEPWADLSEIVGRFVPNERDLEPPTYGIIDADLAAGVTVVADAERSTTPTVTVPDDVWCEYDLEIVSGVAKGVTRRVVDFDGASGDMTIEYPFVDPLFPLAGDVYRLTRVRKAWCTDFFDHITVDTPHDDHFPNYPRHQPWREDIDFFTGDLVEQDGQLWVAVADPPIGMASMPGGSGDWLALPRTPVKNSDGATANGPEELSSPVHGRININTASWRVIATLPMVIDPATGLIDNAPGTVPPYRNDNLAKAIVHFRDVDGNPDPDVVKPHGPFKSIFELNKVVDTRPVPPQPPIPADPAAPNYLERRGFQNAYGTLDFDPFNTGGIMPEDLDDVDGDLSPLDYTATPPADPVTPLPRPPYAGIVPPDGGDGEVYDLVRNDYEERTLVLTRISNMITTRSDSFTVYAVVEGWINAGTPLAERVSQKRVAFIADRSQVRGLVSPQSQTVPTTPVSTE